MRLTDDEYLREQVFKRLKEMGWKDSDLIKDGEERGTKIEPSRWTKYKKNKSGQITDDVLYWICIRIGIDINLRYGKPVFDGNKITWSIPPYNELSCLQNLTKIFGKNG
jgi:hypothetical protein